MSNITELIKNIRNSIYGNDVRESIAGAIEQCYEDASKNGNANMEVTEARGTFSTLNNRLNNSDSVKANRTELEATKSNLQNQIDSLASGSPKGNYATVDALVTANPESGVYVVTENGHIYSWTKDAENAIDLGVYQAMVVADNAINFKKLTNPYASFISNATFNLNKPITIDITNKTIMFNFSAMFVTVENKFFTPQNRAETIYFNDLNIPTLTFNINERKFEVYDIESIPSGNAICFSLYGQRIDRLHEFVSIITNNVEQDFFNRNVFNWITPLNKNFDVDFTENIITIKNGFAFFDGYSSHIINDEISLEFSSTNSLFEISYDTINNTFIAHAANFVYHTSNRYATFLQIYPNTKKFYTPFFSTIVDSENNKDNNKNINNPLTAILSDFSKKSYIKLLGDSITAGMGGTGFTYSENGVGDDKFATLDGYCFANQIIKNINAHYNNKILNLSPVDARISSSGNYTDQINVNSYERIYKNSSSMSFSCFSNYLKIRVYAIKSDRKFTLNVNGTSNVVTYSNDSVAKIDIDLSSYLIENQTNDITITFDEENWIDSIEVKQQIVCENQGLVGYSAKTFSPGSEAFNACVTGQEDLIIYQFGTNDRTRTVGELTSRLSYLIQKTLEKGVENIILMCSCPSAQASDSDSDKISMHDVHECVKTVACKFNLLFIDNFNATQDYILHTGKTLVSLLPDTLHPGDELYKVMYYNICNKLELPCADY